MMRLVFFAAVCIVQLFFCNVVVSAFSFPPACHHQLKSPASVFVTTSSTTTSASSTKFDIKLQSKVDSFIMDENYDYDELLNSAAEQDRKNNNYVKYNSESWLRHRASDRFYRNLLKFNASPIVQNLLDEVAVLLVVSVGIILWNELLIDGYQDFNGIQHDPIFSNSALSEIKLALPMEPFFLCGGPLGLLLVFRNDASYGRYQEGFHLWEKVVSHFNNMLLMASNAAPQSIDKVRDLGLACWALTRTLKHEVSGKFDPKDKYENDIREKLTTKSQAENLLGARNKLYRAQYDIHQRIEPFTDEITVLDKRTLINTVNDIADACVECERLYTTPIPLLYTRHALKFLTFWLTFMPFGFYDLFSKSWNHIMMLPAITVIAFLFFGIEEIAVSLEEPFSILPLDELVEEVDHCLEDVTDWMEANNNNIGGEDAADEVAPRQMRFFPRRQVDNS